MFKEIVNKLKSVLEEDTDLQDIEKIYKGSPNSVPKFPAVIIDLERKANVQRYKGVNGRGHDFFINIIVLDKYLNPEKLHDRLLDLTEKIEDGLVNRRYLDGLNGPNWRVLDTPVSEILFNPIPNKSEFVINTAEIKAIIKTEGK